MNNENFESYVLAIFDRLKETLLIKGAEYSRNNDRLHNFNVGAKITNESRERVLDGMLLKHYISYRDMLDDLDKGVLPSKKYVEEKFGDILIYFMLQEISFKERIDGKDRERIT